MDFLEQIRKNEVPRPVGFIHGLGGLAVSMLAGSFTRTLSKSDARPPGPGPKRRRTASEGLRAWADEWPIKERVVGTLDLAMPCKSPCPKFSNFTINWGQQIIMDLVCIMQIPYVSIIFPSSPPKWEISSFNYSALLGCAKATMNLGTGGSTPNQMIIGRFPRVITSAAVLESGPDLGVQK